MRICDIMEEYKNQPCNNDNDDNVMCVSMWVGFFGGLLF